MNQTWKSWKDSPHTQDVIQNQAEFWKSFDCLAQNNEDVLYPNGLDKTFTTKGISFEVIDAILFCPDQILCLLP